MIRTTLLSTAIASLLLIPASFAAEPSEKSAEDAYRIPVTAALVVSSDMHKTTTVQGVIESVQNPLIKTKVSAEVIKVYVDEGDVVTQGQVLALLDDENFQLDKIGAKADIERLQALLENQRSSLKRDQSLSKRELIPDSRLEASRSAERQTRAQLNHARALLKKANYQLSHTRVVAPISGVIQQRGASVGDYLNPMSPSSKVLFQVVDTEHLRARLYFPENLAHVVKKGMAVTLNRGDQTRLANITRVRPMLELATHSLHALAEFDNAEGWMPGESITASVMLAKHENTLIVPAMAVVRRPAGEVVYRLKDGMAEEVVVSVGLREGANVELLSGVSEGDVIAVDGASYLADKVAVLVQDNDEQAATQ